jgi:hypothetical protein
MFQAGRDPQLAERIARQLDAPVESVPCAGCRPARGRPSVMAGRACATYVCLEGRGLTSCSDCPDFPCDKLAPCAHQADRLPHNTKLYNLLLIRKEGVERFAERAAERNRQYFKGVKRDGGAPIEIPVKFGKGSG